MTLKLEEFVEVTRYMRRNLTDGPIGIRCNRINHYGDETYSGKPSVHAPATTPQHPLMMFGEMSCDTDAWRCRRGGGGSRDTPLAVTDAAR